MLKHLVIKNFALIEHLEIDLNAQLNILTGETGAGKSIILGAIGLLMGNRADAKAILDESEKCVIEGVFDLKNFNLKAIFEELELDFEPETVLRREISAAGKSRAFINDSPVSLDTMKTLSSYLVDIHSQHDNVGLGSNDYQLSIIDSFAQNADKLQAYQVKYFAYAKEQKTLEEIVANAAKHRKEFDYNSHLLSELEQAKLISGEQASLEEELQILENAGEIQTKLGEVLAVLDTAELSVLSGMVQAVQTAGAAAKLSGSFEDIKTRLQSSYQEIKDIAGEVEAKLEKIELDPTRLEALNDRLSLFFNLQKKHGVLSVEELINVQEDLGQKVAIVLDLDSTLNAQKERVSSLKADVQTLGEALSMSRIGVLKQLEQQIESGLIELGIPNAKLAIDHKIDQPTASGFDTINILFSANKGTNPQPLKNVASGGEFARLMMTIKYLIASKKQMPTLIFDEIDTGISGEIAIKMGAMMKEMATKHQIVSITHLHQIAGMGKEHFYVYKDHSASKTISKIKKLSTEERIEEIAKMIGGNNPSEAAYASAKEMINS